LGIGPAMSDLLKGRRLDPAAERALYALTASRDASPILEAGRRPLDWRGRPHHGAARHDRRCLLPGAGLAAGDQRGRGEAAEARTAGFRTWGKSKDHRHDLPQVVIGMAVTRDGIPVRVWCWPGNTSDSALIRQVKDHMRDRVLSRIVWVADRIFTSPENRRYLRRGGNH
jgi:hypothetical protein